MILSDLLMFFYFISKAWLAQTTFILRSLGDTDYLLTLQNTVEKYLIKCR